jgi:copper chaperone CopZ
MSDMEPKSVSLEIEGMTCPRCGERVQRELLDLKGVLEAAVDWEAGSAAVTYDPDSVSADEIVRAPVFSKEWVIESESRVVRHKYTASARSAETVTR